jgi:hypothetical protein
MAVTPTLSMVAIPTQTASSSIGALRKQDAASSMAAVSDPGGSCGRPPPPPTVLMEPKEPAESLAVRMPKHENTIQKGRVRDKKDKLY